jgi:hypothetical protein
LPSPHYRMYVCLMQPALRLDLGSRSPANRSIAEREREREREREYGSGSLVATLVETAPSGYLS